MDTLIKSFDIKKFGRATANYDEAELERLNARLLQQLPFSAVKDRLGFDADERFWLLVRSNIKTLGDAKQWWDIVHGSVAHDTKDFEYLNIASKLLPPEPWDEASWSNWTKAIATETGRKGKELFMPLRLALTGIEYGPEMKILLPMMKRNVVMSRLVPAL